MVKKQKWVIEFEVSEEWIADGFEITETRANCMISAALPFATSSEFSAKIISKPSKSVIKKIQNS